MKLCFEKHVKERGLCKIDSTAGAQNGAKRCPDVDSVAKDRSGAGDNECAEMSRTVKCVDCLWAHGRHSGKKCDTWAKDRSRAGSCNHFKISKTKNMRQLLVGPRLRFGKMRHVGQSKVSKSHSKKFKKVQKSSKKFKLFSTFFDFFFSRFFFELF